MKNPHRLFLQRRCIISQKIHEQTLSILKKKKRNCKWTSPRGAITHFQDSCAQKTSRNKRYCFVLFPIYRPGCYWAASISITLSSMKLENLGPWLFQIFFCSITLFPLLLWLKWNIFYTSVLPCKCLQLYFFQ